MILEALFCHIIADRKRQTETMIERKMEMIEDDFSLSLSLTLIMTDCWPLMKSITTIKKLLCFSTYNKL